MLDYHKFQLYFYITLLALTLLMAFFVFLPYLSAIAFALVLAMVFSPVNKKLIKTFKGHESISAFLTTLLIIITIIVPFFFISILVFNEARSIFIVSLNQYPESFGKIISSFKVVSWAEIKNLWQYIKQTNDVLGWVITNASLLFTNIIGVIVSLLLGFLSIYYFLKDGERIKKYFISVSPLMDKYDRAIFDKLHVAVKSVVMGSLIIAVIQGILAGAGFYLFNIPSSAFWGAVTAFASLIPSVGTGLVLAPAIIYLFYTGDIANGTGLLIWGAVVVGAIDNMLRPKILERKMEIHPLLILFSVLGGLKLFGVMGFVLGPLSVSLLIALLDIYQNEFKQYFEELKESA